MITYNPHIEPGDVIAVGDIHGRYDLLCEFVDRVRGKNCTVIFLGDLVDRGPQDVEVLVLVRDMIENPDRYGLAAVYCLKGNHEDMFVAAVRDGWGWREWVQNGGNHLRADELKEHVGWVKELPVYMIVGDTLFVHAGVHPGHDPANLLKEGRGQDLMWIRGVFLLHGAELWRWTDKIKRVVHGHTVTAFECKLGGIEGEPFVYKDRVNIDTGAVFTNILTSYNTTQGTFWQHYLGTTEDEPETLQTTL